MPVPNLKINPEFHPIILEANPFIQFVDFVPCLPAGRDQLVTAGFLREGDHLADQLAADAFAAQGFINEHVLHKTERRIVQIVAQKIQVRARHFFAVCFYGKFYALAGYFFLFDIHSRFLMVEIIPPSPTWPDFSAYRHLVPLSQQRDMRKAARE